MTGNLLPWSNENDLPVNFEVQDFAIGGKLLTVKFDFSQTTVLTALNDAAFRDHVRQTLAKHLAERIMQEGLVEYTQLRDPVTQTLRVAARCYLAPNDQVKILRTHVKK